jgi:2-enoate reductase
MVSKIFSKLFEPVQIGKVRIKNRIAMAPMGILNPPMVNPDGSPTQRTVDYYVERAKGGVGLIITGAHKVENEIDVVRLGFAPMISPAMRSPYGEMSEAVHSLGAKIFIQLTPGVGRVLMPRHVDPTGRSKPVSASPISNCWDPAVICRELATEEVERIVKAVGDAAEIVKAAEIDGIELHGHEGYLLDQFATAIWNKRTDKYGGHLKGRLTFPIEILKEIKARVGKDFPVVYRFALKHYIKALRAGALPGEDYTEAGRDVEEGLEMAKLLEEAGFDALHVDAGCYDSWYWAHPPIYQEHGCMVDMAEKVKKIVKIPVMAVGRLDIPELAEKVVEEGKADIIVIGRGLLADPYWPTKVQEGRIEDIRPCIGCHDGNQRMLQGKPLSCAVNPACGRERLYGLKTAEEARTVLVAGGGVAGMEAARVAAIRGHKVTLYEKGKALGGHLREASVPDFKKDLGRLNEWYKVHLSKLEVEVKLETEVTTDIVERENPDVVLVTTGSKPIIPDIPGIEKPNVVTCIDLLLSKREAGEFVVVLGAGLIGCETALWLAKQGRRITIVEMLPEPLITPPPLFNANKLMLLDLLALNKVKIEVNTTVQDIADDGIIAVNKDLKHNMTQADTVVLAVGLEPDDQLYKSLIGKVANLYALGDCQEPRRIMGAIWDGYEVARSI